jgi:hypothetical protein
MSRSGQDSMCRGLYENDEHMIPRAVQVKCRLGMWNREYLGDFSCKRKVCGSVESRDVTSSSNFSLAITIFEYTIHQATAHYIVAPFRAFTS